MKSIDLALNVASPSCNAHENEIQHELFPSNETGGSHFNTFLNFIISFYIRILSACMSSGRAANALNH